VELVISRDGEALQHPDDLSSLRVVVSGDLSASDLATAVERVHLGRSDEESAHVWIPLDELRRLSAGRVAADWEERFERMVAYAASRGWVSGDGRSVRAHVESQRLRRRLRQRGPGHEGGAPVRAVVWNAREDVVVTDVPRLDPGPGQVLVQVAYNRICGTDLREYYGGPIFIPTEPHPLTEGFEALHEGRKMKVLVDPSA